MQDNHELLIWFHLSVIQLWIVYELNSKTGSLFKLVPLVNIY